MIVACLFVIGCRTSRTPFMPTIDELNLCFRTWSLSSGELVDPTWELDVPFRSFCKDRLRPMIMATAWAVENEGELQSPSNGRSVRQYIRGWVGVICSHLVRDSGRARGSFLIICSQLAVNRASIQDSTPSVVSKFYEVPGEAVRMLEVLRDLVADVGFQGDEYAATSHVKETVGEMLRYAQFVQSIGGGEDDFDSE